MAVMVARITWNRNLVRARMPRPRRGPRIPSQSSMAPRAAKLIMTSSGSKTERPRTSTPISETEFSMTVINVTGKINMTPPMVGVPILVMCLPGSSTRISLPILKCRRARINGPPQMTAIIKPRVLSARARGVSMEPSVMSLPPGQTRCGPCEVHANL
jgi:hypothetical protein